MHTRSAQRETNPVIIRGRRNERQQGQVHTQEPPRGVAPHAGRATPPATRQPGPGSGHPTGWPQLYNGPHDLRSNYQIMVNPFPPFRDGNA